jgi:hypothetical protein
MWSFLAQAGQITLSSQVTAGHATHHVRHVGYAGAALVHIGDILPLWCLVFGRPLAAR